MLTCDRCDGCGRFMSAPALVVERWTENLHDGPSYDEDHYCARCAS